MRLVRAADFTTSRWKNGGGVTHEIARAEAEGGLLWRLSVAEVAQDGAFSLFPGLSRSLTVVEGPGMVLHGPAGADLVAAPLVPVVFSGDLAIFGRLNGGACRDFNLIWDATQLAGAVDPAGPGAAPPADGLYCLSGGVGPAGPGDFLWCDGATPMIEGRALAVTLTPR